MMAGGDALEDEEDKEELDLAIGSSKQVELGGSSKQIKLDTGAKDAAADMGEQGLVEHAEDITRD